MKILYGILNYRRSFDNTKELFDAVPAEKSEDVLILRKDSLNFHDKKTYKEFVKKPDKSVAKSKNMILKHAKENGYDFCFILEDDLIIKDETAFDNYITLMNELNYNVMFYGFDNRNRVLNNIKPNPCLAIRVTDEREVFASRNPCSTMMCFRISDDMIMFDESMQALELEFYLWDQLQAGGIRSFGFFPDIANSWQYFDNTGEKKIRVLDSKVGGEDMQRRKDTKFDLDMNADAFLAFLQKSYYKDLEIEVNGEPVNE
jgi:hypothetical protein